MTYYKTIEGIKYDRQLLELADHLAQNTTIDLITIQQIWAEVSDANRIPPTEKLTLHYIQQRYPITPEAMTWMSQQLHPTVVWQDEINSLFRKILELPDLQWEIDQRQLLEQVEKNQDLTVKKILTGVLQAIYNNSLGYFALWHVSRDKHLQKIWINSGKLSLLDPDKDQHRLTPGFWKDGDEWLHFLLDIPSFSPTQLVIYIRLSSPSAYGFCKSISKRELALATALDEIVVDRLKFTPLAIGKYWEWAEEEEQGLTNFSLGWRDALYLALSDGVHNQESDITFQSAFLWEDWFELEGFEGIRRASHAFLKAAKIHYIPRQYQALATEGGVLTKVPKAASLDFDSFWYFLLLSEEYPDRQVIAYCRKNGDGIEDAWHDLYFAEEEEELKDQINTVLQQEFALIDLEIIVDAGEFERQKNIYRSGWRPNKTVFRQLLNCLLKDGLSDDSYLQMIYNSQADLSEAPNAFTPQAKAKFYLNKSKIQLKKIEESDQTLIQHYWIFSLQTPALSNKTFEVFVPRNPDFEEVTGVPYNQMT